MNTSDSSKACPKCGATVPSDAPQGLCPQCVLAAAAAPEVAATATAQIPSLERLAVAFPQLQILELIGRGGMGFVFKARQPHLDRFVALKLLPDSLAQDAHFAERFNREGRTLARLNHPNIVSIFDFGQAGGFYFLLMEYVDGVNLRQAMQAGRFSPSEALAIVPKICEALQYAHEEGVLHRDIKPENLLLDAKGRVKIADFGIAKIVGDEKPDVSLTATGAALGTPHYMAPEQFEKPGTVDHRADIYSLGVVFYEMLTGELPIGRFALPSQKTPVDTRVDDVVLRTLEKEREKRFQSAGEMKTNVEHLTSTAPASPLPRPSIANAGGHGTIAIKPEDVLPTAPKWSVKAICGTVLVALTFLIPVLGISFMLLNKGATRGVSWPVTAITLIFMGLAGLPGTLLGWLALSDIRTEAGKQRGLPFAVFAALAIPLTLLVGMVLALPFFILYQATGQSGPGILTRVLAFVLPAGTITFAIWSIYATARWGANRSLSKRRGVLKWVFFGLIFCAMGLGTLIAPKALRLSGAFKDGPRPEVRYRVFEMETAVADELVPASLRETGPTGNWQMSEISPETLATLLKNRVLNKHVMVDRNHLIPSSKSAKTIVSTYKPGAKVQQQEIRDWPLVSDSWGHTLGNQVLNDFAEVSGHGFFGVRRKDGALQLKVQHKITHKIGARPAVDVNISYEGHAPQNGALAFLLPFARKDDSTGYLVFAVEVNSAATGSEPPQPVVELSTDNTPPSIQFTFTAVELREIRGVRWLAFDYLDDVHGDCDKSFPWKSTIPGFKAETRTTEFINEAKDNSPSVRHQRVEYRMPDQFSRMELEDLRDSLEKSRLRKSIRLGTNEQHLLFELPSPQGGSLQAWIKVMPPVAQVSSSSDRPATHSSPLEFRFIADTTDTQSPVDELFWRNQAGTATMHRVLRTVVLDGSSVAQAGIETDSKGFRSITIELTPEAAGKFGRITATNINRQLAMVANGRVLYAPIIRTAITAGIVKISGSFSDAEARQLASELNQKTASMEFSAPVELLLPRQPEFPPGAILLDLDSGLLKTNLTFRGDEQATWDSLQVNGADLLAVGTSNQTPVLSTFDLLSIEVPDNAWDSMFPEDVVWNWTLMRAAAKKESLLGAAPGRSATFLFRTREKGFGVLQFLPANNPTREVKIRYKMVKNATAGKSEQRNSVRKIELRIPTITDDPYKSVGVTTDSELPVGEYLVGLLERPDGRVEEKPAVVNIHRGFGRGGAMKHLLWTMNQFESNYVRNILGEMRSTLDGRVIELAPDERSPVFRATNTVGAVTKGFIALRSQNLPASDLPPVTVSIAEVPQHWYMFLSVKIRVSAPPGFYPSAVGLLEDGSEVETQTSIMGNGRGGAWSGDSCMWHFPSEFQTSDVQEIVRQLELTRVTSPNGIRIPPGQRVPMFSVTNKTGTIFRGYFELLGTTRMK